MSKQPHRPQDAFRQAIEKLESYSYEDLTQWLVSRLNGRDVLLRHTGEDSLAYPVAAVYPHLSRPAREDVLRATTSLLLDLAAGRNWTGRPAEELLLLVQQLAPEEAKDILCALANSERFSNLDHDVQYRVLQGMISLRVRMPPSFWRGMFDKNRVAFAGLAFDGLAMTSVEQAIGLLPLLPDDESVAELIANALPGLVEHAQESLPRIRHLCSDRLAELKPLIRDEIEHFWQDEGMPLEAAEASDDLVDDFSPEDARDSLFTLDEEERVGEYAEACV